MWKKWFERPALKLAFGAGAVLLLTLAGHVQAQQANEAGTTLPQVFQFSPFMEVRVSSQPTNIPIPGTVLRQNDMVATYTIKPLAGAVLKAAATPRLRTFPLSQPAGAYLFQVNVDNGYAFCAFRVPQQGLRETQCFRDINLDGTFDASYQTFLPILGEKLYLGRIARMTPIAPVPYESVDVSALPTDDWAYRFVRVRNGLAEFKPQFGPNRRGFMVLKCDIAASKPCRLGAHIYRFTQNGETLLVDSIEPSTNEFWLISEEYN